MPPVLEILGYVQWFCCIFQFPCLRLILLSFFYYSCYHGFFNTARTSTCFRGLPCSVVKVLLPVMLASDLEVISLQLPIERLICYIAGPKVPIMCEYCAWSGMWSCDLEAAFSILFLRQVERGLLGCIPAQVRQRIDYTGFPVIM